MTRLSISSEHKRVLVLDGGCLRGLGSLFVLEELSRVTGEEPCEFFDLICGSGCGGIVAILLGRLGMSCHKAIEAYKKLALALCGSQATEFHSQLLGSGAFFDSTAFDDLLAEILTNHISSTEKMITNEEDESTTRTLVTTAHVKSNRVYQIRSYIAPPQTAFLAPPKNHNWSVSEATKATFSCPFFMPPVLIEGKFQYSDAGFAGFNNPIHQASVECQKLWGSQEPVVFISLGTSLQSLSDAFHTTGTLESRFPPDWNAAALAQSKAKFAPLAERFSIIARQTSAITLGCGMEDIPLRQCLRLDPPLDIPEIVLCDVYYETEIRRSVSEWVAGDGAVVIKEISALVPKAAISPGSPITRAEMEERIKQAQTFEVPKPPPGTVNPDYNPELDKKRPTTIDEYLRRYHVLFVIDDSGSMKGKLWKEAQDALKKISDYAVANLTAKIEVMFLNSPQRISATKGGPGVLSIFNIVSPQRGTPTGARLRGILNEHISLLDAAVHTPTYSTICPLDIIVITDGRPTDDPAAIMQEAVARMRHAKHHPNCIGVQFVQIGNDKKAKKVLEALVHGENGSMVDTVPYDGVLTAERLERILLGGLHPNVRAMIL